MTKNDVRNFFIYYKIQSISNDFLGNKWPEVKVKPSSDNLMTFYGSRITTKEINLIN